MPLALIRVGCLVWRNFARGKDCLPEFLLYMGSGILDYFATLPYLLAI
jgi:hypothetical protein